MKCQVLLSLKNNFNRFKMFSATILLSALRLMESDMHSAERRHFLIFFFFFCLHSEKGSILKQFASLGRRKGNEYAFREGRSSKWLSHF